PGRGERANPDSPVPAGDGDDVPAVAGRAARASGAAAPGRWAERLRHRGRMRLGEPGLVHHRVHLACRDEPGTVPALAARMTGRPESRRPESGRPESWRPAHEAFASAGPP